MPIRSVISIDVDDQAFKSFLTLFQKYQQQLAQQPPMWQAVGTATARSAGQFNTLMAAMLTHNQMLQHHITSQNTLAKTLAHQTVNFGTLVNNSRLFAHNIHQATLSLAKWAGLSGMISGAIGAGGLFGLDRLAASVAGMRQSAAGLGLTVGQERAFNLDFGRFLASPGSVLSSVAAALTDPTNPAYRPLTALLGNVQGQDAADVSARLLQKLPQLFPRGANDPTLGTIAQAYGLTNIMSVEDIKRYLSASPQERAQQEAKFRGDVEGLQLAPGDTLAWQNFKDSLTRAGASIETVLIRGLSPLAQPLSELSGSLSNLLTTLLTEMPLKQWMHDLGEAIDGWATKLKDPKTIHDIEETFHKLTDEADKLVKGFEAVVTWIDDHFGTAIAAGNAASQFLGGVNNAAQGMGAAMRYGAQSLLSNLSPGGMVDEYGRPVGGSSRHQSYQPLPTSEQAKAIQGDIADAFAAAGFNMAAASGAVGTAAQESGFKAGMRHWDPTRAERARGMMTETTFGHGLWSERGEEWQRYLAWLTKTGHQGSEWSDPKLQSEFLAWNIRTNYPGLARKLDEVTDPGESAALITHEYLRPDPAQANYPHRMAAAKQFFAEHTQTPKQQISSRWPQRGPEFYVDPKQTVVSVHNNTGGSSTTIASQLPSTSYSGI